MKTIVSILSFLLILCFSGCIDKGIKKTSEIDVNMDVEKSQKLKKLRHIVLLKFNKTATASDIQEVEQAFTGLQSKIEQIREFEWGLNNSPENLNKGFSHGFVLTFDNEKDRDLYLYHPDHKKFGKILEPILKDVLVLDYWTNQN